ncbi:aldehyde dehydrogenase family protein [Vogesella sp. AC12]|uniref:aldehyde dehydrogenase family protein n=1 Tax=Vogesella sp. AC12 TaxID=2950550 RepID=UPI0021099984|nr:aldehyde dehydrogenase family protein [Vogesella sp. AC12]
MARLPDFDSAVPLLNAHQYGSDRNIFTRPVTAACEFGGRIQVGMIGANLPIPLPMVCHRFGGEASLFGDQHGYGPEVGLLSPHAGHDRALAGKTVRRIGDADDEVTLSTMRDYPLSLFCPAQAGFFSG